MVGPAALGVSTWKSAHLSHSHIHSPSLPIHIKSTCSSAPTPTAVQEYVSATQPWTLSDWAHTFKTADTISVFINSDINGGKKPFNVWWGVMEVMQSLPAQRQQL